MLDDSYLEHYGVPGMKWGRRKARGVSTTGNSAASSSRKKKAKKIAKVALGAAAAAGVGYAAYRYAKDPVQNRKQQSTRNEAMDDIIRRYAESARAAGRNADEAYARATQFANDIRNSGKINRR